MIVLLKIHATGKILGKKCLKAISQFFFRGRTGGHNGMGELNFLVRGKEGGRDAFNRGEDFQKFGHDVGGRPLSLLFVGNLDLSP